MSIVWFWSHLSVVRLSGKSTGERGLYLYAGITWKHSEPDYEWFLTAIWRNTVVCRSYTLVWVWLRMFSKFPLTDRGARQRIGYSELFDLSMTGAFSSCI